MEDRIIVLKSAYNKTQDQVFFIQPCVDPITGLYPSCVREVSDTKTHQMILSEQDKTFLSKGGVLLPASKAIKVQHGSSFNLDDPLQAAQWEAIKNSPLIAPDRIAKDTNGNFIVDGEKPYVTDSGVVRGRYGLADLYIERPGNVAKNKNEFRKKVLKAQNLIAEDSLEGWIVKCKLLEKDMSRANSNDIEDFLFTQAEKFPEKIIELYTGTTTAIRLLLLEALDKSVVVKKNNLFIYADEIVLGASMDAAVTYLSQPENIRVKALIQAETFPEMRKANVEKAAAAKTKN